MTLESCSSTDLFLLTRQGNVGRSGSTTVDGQFVDVDDSDGGELMSPEARSPEDVKVYRSKSLPKITPEELSGKSRTGDAAGTANGIGVGDKTCGAGRRNFNFPLDSKVTSSGSVMSTHASKSVT